MEKLVFKVLFLAGLRVSTCSRLVAWPLDARNLGKILTKDPQRINRQETFFSGLALRFLISTEFREETRKTIIEITPPHLRFLIGEAFHVATQILWSKLKIAKKIQSLANSHSIQINSLIHFLNQCLDELGYDEDAETWIERKILTMVAEARVKNSATNTIELIRSELIPTIQVLEKSQGYFLAANTIKLRLQVALTSLEAIRLTPAKTDFDSIRKGVEAALRIDKASTNLTKGAQEKIERLVIEPLFEKIEREFESTRSLMENILEILRDLDELSRQMPAIEKVPANITDIKELLEA